MENKELKSMAREYAFQFLYHLQLDDFSKSKVDLQKENGHILLDERLVDFENALIENNEKKDLLTSFDLEAKNFAKELILGVIKKSSDLEKEIEKCSTNWSLAKMNKVDLTLLLLACFELNHVSNTPGKVVINEAINIAKKFGTNNSSSFVNGVLNKLFELNNNN